MVAVIVADTGLNTPKGLSVQSVPVLPLCNSLWDFAGPSLTIWLRVPWLIRSQHQGQRSSEAEVKCYVLKILYFIN